MRLSDQVLTGRIRLLVEKTAHGLSTGHAVYFDGTDWQKAKSDVSTTLGVGIVEVFDADKFFVITAGYISGLTGLTVGKTYYVSDATAGLLTSVESNLYSNPLMVALSATEGVVLSHRPQRFSDNNQLVTQVAHGFTVGQVLKLGSGVYSLAQADTGANLGIWVVTEVLTPDVFRVAKSGFIAGLSGGTPDETWYLSSTVAGGMTNAAPTIAQPIIYWVTSTSGWLLGYPAAASGTPISGAAPNGYNKLSLSFVGNTITYEGDTVVQGQLFGLNNSVIVSGAAGWRYGAIDTSGNASHEVIPVAEIIADTQQYTPAPPFDPAWNGYYSTVNPTKRICWILYFDGTDILEVIPYGNGYNKNDDCWLSSGTGIIAATPGDRLQYTAAFQKTRGTEIVCTDNGAGNTDASGFRVTFNSAGKAAINISFDISLAVSTSYYVSVRKNGAYYKQGIAGLNILGAGITLVSRIEVTINDYVQAGDYFTFMIESGNGNNITILNPSVMFTRV